MMQCRRIFEDTQIHVIACGAGAGGFGPVDADFTAGRGRVGQQPRLERGIAPRFCNQPRACGRSDLLGPLGKFAMIFGGEQALLDRQLANCYFNHFEIGNFVDHRGRRVVVTAVVV
jgi:hypothetical protein